MKKVSRSSLYGVLGVFGGILIATIVYCSITWVRGSQLLGNLDEVRSWHKKAYKLLAGLAIVEHCVFFTCVPIMVYHSLGLSMSRCLSASFCAGMSNMHWVTVSVKDDKVRTQELLTQPVTAHLTADRLAVFGGLLASLAFAILTVVFYMYGEASRRTLSKNGKSRSCLTLFRRRTQLVVSMGCFTLTQLLFGILGIALVKSNWFAGCIVLAGVSLYPVSKLYKGLTKEATITRFQFRKVSQTCVTLVFLWLYCSGCGISSALMSGIDLTSSTIFDLAGSTAMAQIILILVFHLIFSALSATALYIHLSVTDIIESLKKTEASLTVVVEDPPTPKQRMPEVTEPNTPAQPNEVISWEARHCASCNTNDPNCVLVPCGHSVICSDCSNVLLTIPGFRCPLCCTEVIDSQVVSK